MRKKFVKYSLELVREDSVEYDSKICTKEDAYQKLLEVFKLDKKSEEYFVMFALNCKNQILGAFLVAKGTLDEITLSITDIIKRTLLCNASRIIVAHNHPSGDVIPSKIDINTTKRLKDCCSMFGISLLDHLIIGSDSYNSIIDRVN